MSVVIRIDDMITWLDDYTLITMFAEIGGFASFFYAFSRICTRKIAVNWFIGNLIENLFRVRKPNSEEDNKKLMKLAKKMSSQ